MCEKNISLLTIVLHTKFIILWTEIWQRILDILDVLRFFFHVLQLTNHVPDLFSLKSKVLSVDRREKRQ